MELAEKSGERWGEHLSYREAESYSGLSRTTLWRLLKSRKIEAGKAGTSVRISRASIDRYMREHAFAAS